MALYDQIKAIYPTLEDKEFIDLIQLQNDSNGKGDYIKSWTNSNPQPTEAQLTATGK
jgi:hypothetical protein